MNARPAGHSRGGPAFLALVLFAGAVIGVSLWTQASGPAEFPLLARQGPWLTLATLLAVWGVRQQAGTYMDRLAALADRRAALWIAGAATLVVLLASARIVLEGFPNSADEYAYLLQAQTYARGRLWVAAPAPPEFFEMIRYFIKDGIYISPYQPGWSLILAPFARVGWPLWTVNPMLGAITAVALFRLVETVVNRRAAWLGGIALVTSAFFLLNFASYFSHGAGALASIGFAIFALEYLRTGRWWHAVLAGACVGYLGFVRAFNAIFLMLPFAATLLLTPGRRIGLIWLGLGGGPWLAALLGYYAAVTGSPLTPVQVWYDAGGEPLGASTLAMLESVRRLVRLYFWTSPLFLPAWGLALIALVRGRRLDFLDWIAPLTLIGFAFYGGHGGNQYGPRYLFECWPFFVLTIVKAADPLLFGPGASRWRAWVAAAAVVHLTFQLAYLGPRFDREHAVVEERLIIDRKIAQAGLANAVVILGGPVGKIRPMWPIDLTRNGLEPFRRSVVRVKDLGPRNRELPRLFPGRRIYVYRDGALTPAPL